MLQKDRLMIDRRRSSIDTCQKSLLRTYFLRRQKIAVPSRDPFSLKIPSYSCLANSGCKSFSNPWLSTS